MPILSGGGRKGWGTRRLASAGWQLRPVCLRFFLGTLLTLGLGRSLVRSGLLALLQLLLLLGVFLVQLLGLLLVLLF